LRFYNICIEGPDCSGKTTLFNKIHKATNFAYNIQDRSFVSMYVHSKFYGREDTSFWYEKLFEDLKRLNTLYVIVVPKEEVLVRRIEKRGDNFQDSESIKNLRETFFTLARFRLSFLPNVIFTENDDTDLICEEVLTRLRVLETLKGGDLIRSFVMNGFENEQIDISFKDIVDINNLDYDVLKFPEEEEYYNKICEKIMTTIRKQLMGLNCQIQKHDSRRFIYTDDSCISMVHALWRKNKLSVSATLRSSNVMNTLWADYEFLKILSYYIADELNVEDCPIELTVNIRSAHIIP
jgi:hypothetical protein